MDKSTSTIYDINVLEEIQDTYDIHIFKSLKNPYDIHIFKSLKNPYDIFFSVSLAANYHIWCVPKVLDSSYDILIAKTVQDEYDIFIHRVLASRYVISVENSLECLYHIHRSKNFYSSYSILFLSKTLNCTYKLQLSRILYDSYDIPPVSKSLFCSYKICISQFLSRLQKIKNYADLYQKGFITPNYNAKAEVRALFSELENLSSKVDYPEYADVVSEEQIIPYVSLLDRLRLLFHGAIHALTQTDLSYYAESLTAAKTALPSFQTALEPAIDVWKNSIGNIYKQEVLKVSYTGNIYETYIKFNLEGQSIPLRAYLSLVPTAGSWATTNIGVYRIQENWSENNIPDDISYVSTPTATLSLTNNKSKVDITSMVQGWIRGDYTNYGMLLKCTDNNYRTTRTFGSSRYSATYFHPHLLLYTPQEVKQYIRLNQPPAPAPSSWRWQQTNNTYLLRWSCPEDSRLIGFNIYYSTNLGTTWTKLNTNLFPAAQNQAVVSTGRGDIYTDFAVTSVIEYGEGGQQKESAKTKAADIWGTRYVLSWQDIDDAVKYRIYKGEV